MRVIDNSSCFLFHGLTFVSSTRFPSLSGRESLNVVWYRKCESPVQAFADSGSPLAPHVAVLTLTNRIAAQTHYSHINTSREVDVCSDLDAAVSNDPSPIRSGGHVV